MSKRTEELRACRSTTSPRASPVLRCFTVLLLVVIALSLLAAGLLISQARQSHRIVDSVILRLDAPASGDTQPVQFTIYSGESGRHIADRLEAQGLVRSALLFRLLSYYYGVETGLQAGDYELQPNMTSTEILSRLHRGLVRVEEVTIPEGWREAEIVELLIRRDIFERHEIVKALAGEYDYDFLSSRPPGSSLEGYLFPDTYQLSARSQAADFVAQMLGNFDRQFTLAMRDQARNRGFTIHQVLTLASIVEREAVSASERPQIAAVFLNRLRLGMRLDADPTVQYALGGDPASVTQHGFWKVGLTRADLAIASPYNTYRNTGLPAGPIANPGLASIKAVLEPATGDYLYFVARGDGTHVFARTLQEHNENVQRYQR